MPSQIFVNLPVKDLDRSVRFFTALGYRFNPKFTDSHATCMIVADNISVMLLVEPFFQGFTKKPISDAKAATEVLIALSFDSRAEAAAMVNKALAAGAKTPVDAKDHGFMWQHGFEDLDGHQWEVSWMDPNATPHG